MIWNLNRFARQQEQKAAPALHSETYLQTVARRFRRHKLAIASVTVLLAVALLAILAPVLTPYDPAAISPHFSAPPSAQHWLGTDQVGRDVLTRLLYATRISLVVGVVTAVAATTVGVVLGLASGYFGGVVDMVVMRVTDVVMSFPYILLVLVSATVFKPGLATIIAILVFVDWPSAARLVRGNVLSLRETNFVKSNIVAGMPKRHILLSEILPNTLAPVLVYATNVTALS